MPPFWGVLLRRQRRRRRRDAEAPRGLGLSSEAAAAAAEEAQAAAEAAAGSGAAAGEWGGRGITGRAGGREGREAGGRRRGAGPVLAAAGHQALRARPLLVPRAPGPDPRSPSRVSGSFAPRAPPRWPGACPAAQGDPPSWPRSLSRALCLTLRTQRLRSLPRGSAGLFFFFFPAAVPDAGCLPGTPSRCSCRPTCSRCSAWRAGTPAPGGQRFAAAASRARAPRPGSARVSAPPPPPGVRRVVA